MEIKDIIEKYEKRYEECEEQFASDVSEISDANISQERLAWLNEDMISLNGQLGAYECIIRDLKRLLQ